MLFKTSSKWIITAAIVIALGIWLIPVKDKKDTADQADNTHPKYEMQQKQSLVDHDIALTDRLCRLQCSADLRHMTKQLEKLPDKSAEMKLAKMRAEHPHMIELIWKKANGTFVHSGGLPTFAYKRLEQYLNEAEQAIDQHKAYESTRIHSDKDHFLVLGFPGEAGGGMLGVVRQSILNSVSDHQTKNLRLVPYPPEGNYKIESVDSDTHKDIHVTQGEDNGGASHYHKYQVVVKFAEQPDDTHLNRIEQRLQLSKVQKLGYTYVFESKVTTAEEMIDYFRSNENIVYVEPHYLYMTNETPPDAASTNEPPPNDYLFEPYQWNLPITDTLSGWTISKGSDEIIVGVLDTGVDLTHPDLKGRLVEGVNLVNPDEAPYDQVGHGTHVAGVISASVNNNEGVAGMTWYDKVMPIKVLDDSGAGSTYSVAEGIIWAADHGAKVINMSLGNYAQAQFLHDAIRYAFDKDVVLIAATGNDNTEEPGYPAAYPEVFAVSAIDERQQRAEFSNYGSYVDVVAPGVSIASTYPDNQYAALSGTSMACPHVTALAALIRAVNPLLKNTEVMEIMQRTASDLGPAGKDPYYGYGQINVSAALQEALQMKQSVHLFPEWVQRDVDRIRMKYENEDASIE